jgi:glyoxylate/hydroxypyruvate reductase A
MKLLLAGRFEAAEEALWYRLLAAELAGHELLIAPSESDRRAIEAAIVANPPPDALQGLPRLRLVQSLWAGVDRLLADPTLPPEVPIARMVDPALAHAMAETALWAVLSLHRGYFDYQRQQRLAIWRQLAQQRADEVAVLLLGLGEMGRHCAVALKRAGYRVSAWTRSGRTEAPDGVGVIGGADALRRQLAGTEVVVNLLPLTADTRGLLDAAFFAAMPRHGAVVNLGRGAHVVDADLLLALDEDRLRHAVLDVFHHEPLPADHRYWQHDRVTVLPHAAALTDPRSAARVVAANVQALAEGRPVAHRVDRTRGY